VENENYFIFCDTKKDYKLLIMLLLDGESANLKHRDECTRVWIEFEKGCELSRRNVFYAVYILGLSQQNLMFQTREIIDSLAKEIKCS